MFVIHGWWATGVNDDGRLLLWAEDSTARTEPERRRGRRPNIQDHPFALACDDLVKLLDLAALPSLADAATAVLALPTRGGSPIPSPELSVATIRADDDVPDAMPVAQSHWRVPVVELGADAALLLLRSSDGHVGEFGDDDVVIDPPLFGADLKHLRALAEFAIDLTRRGRVLPGVRAVGPRRGLAIWRPIVTGPDAGWLRTVAAGLPASALAVVTDRSGPSSAAECVAAMTDALVDAAVRAALPSVTARAAARRDPTTSWRTALIGPDRSFEADAATLATLDAALSMWQQDAVVGGEVRACFRLAEPEAAEPDSGAPSWRLEFGLQASDEPSLVVDATKVWRARGKLRALARHVDNPQETLLAELGRAVRLYPAIEPALRTAHPSALSFDTAGAHEFLTDAAPLLMASGFGVVLPGWWTNPSMRLGARLRASTPSQPGSAGNAASIGQEGLVDFRWQLAVGEHALTDDEISELIDAQQPLVRVRGQWMQVDAEKLSRARAFFQRRGRGANGRMTVGEVLHALGSDDDGPGGLPVVGVEADGWLGALLSPDADQRLASVPAPAGFHGRLRPYQERGLSWLSFLGTVGLGGLLADDMGLGKTIQLLALFAGDRETDGEAVASVGPTLLVCPMSLVGNWQREAARFTPALRVHVHHGKERPRGKAFEAAVATSDLVVTTYALLARDAAALAKVDWHRVVLDEAQAVKNAATQAALAARSLPAQRRIAVTGTPVENRLADLWSLMEFANPGLLGKAKQFKDRFATPIERYGDPEAGARLRALTTPFVLRRLKTDASIISDLPEKLEMEVVCSLTAEQAALYQAVVDDMLERIATTKGIERRGLVLATMTKLKQVCNHPAQFLRDGSRLSGRSGKLARLEEILDEVLAVGEKALLFTQYAEFGGMLRAHLLARFGGEVAFLHGGVSKTERDAMVTRFQNSGGPSLFVLSLKAGGTGLTLTAANHVVHVDRWWNPAVEDQATDRAFRIGQKRAVQVRKFVCAGTLEEKISAMIQEKRGLAASIVGTGEGWLTELSTAQLRDLFTLEAGAVVE